MKFLGCVLNLCGVCFWFSIFDALFGQMEALNKGFNFKMIFDKFCLRTNHKEN